MRFVAKFFLGLIIFCVVFVSLFYLFGDKIFLQPAQVVSYVRSISTNRVSTVATALNLPQTYAFDNADGFGWDFNGDSLTDFLTYSADRVTYLGHDNSERLFLDGIGKFSGDSGSGMDNALIVRIDDDSQNPNKYVIVKSGLANYLGAGTNSWDYRKTLEVYALNNFNTYSAGQKIEDLSYIIDSGDNYIYYIMGDVVAKPGQPAFLVAATRDFGKMRSYLLNVDTAGAVTLNSVNEIGCPTHSPNANPGGEIPQCHRGNGMLYTTLCRTDSSGVNTGVCEKYLLNNEFFRISSTGAMAKVGDWFSINNQNLPIVGGGSELISFRYGLSYGHVDSQFVVNRGTPQNPDYRLFILFDSGLRRIYSAKISIDSNGILTLTPQFATAGGGGSLPTAAQEIGLIGRVQGLQGGPYIANSEKLFDIDGNVVASINQHVTPFDCSVYTDSVSCNSNTMCLWTSADGWTCLLKSASWMGYPHSWPANYGGEYIFDEIRTHGRGPYGYGFAGAGVLAHFLPTITTTTNPNSGIAFEDVGTALPSGPAMTFSWFRRMAPFVEIDADGFVKVKMVKFRNQQHASLLQAPNEGPVWQAQTQAQKDIWFAWAQHASVAADRGYDSWSLWYNLDSTPGSAPPPPTNLQSSFN